MSFPDNFTWGAAAASYQIEGAWNADDKGLSVWDMLTRQPGKIWEGHTGDTACDHYNRYREDVGLMGQIGLNAYRLSVSWPRILPAGTGAISEAGLGFYDRLVDTLLAAGIQPWVTLFHWDFPHALFLRGGWLNPDSSKWFSEYTAAVVDRLSDRVTHWMTLNEPQCFIGLGHLFGEHAPGLKLGLAEVLTASHNVLLAHGRAVQVIRARARTTPQIGWAPVGVAYTPATDTTKDRRAADLGMAAVYPGTVWNNTWWGDPVVLGRYPEEGLRAYGNAVPRHTDADMAVIAQPIDFYGANIYNASPVRLGPDGREQAAPLPVGHPHTHFTWKVTPDALYWGTKFLHERYQLPVVVTENGLSLPDWVSLDGAVHDPLRIDFLNRYLNSLGRAIADGVDVRGYFQWSILDNFEWAEGYKHRFGLIHVDYATQKRTLKDSARWYAEVIRTNGASLGT
ncbi:MAG: GH1 family beta-glucosidase [Verrucomicrobiota bacterium]